MGNQVRLVRGVCVSTANGDRVHSFRRSEAEFSRQLLSTARPVL